MKSSQCLRYCLLAVTLLALAPAHAARLALVIGNAAYTDGPLKNPVNDARAVDQKLATMGFKVQRIENLKRAQIGRTITAFASTIRAGDEVVVFYAGHGVQVKGINYLPAVDADIQSEEDVPLNSLNLNNLMDRLDDAKSGLKILFLDACRNNPYARSFRSADRGLARVGAAPSGTLIHFATRPGSVAADGAGGNGLYTTELLRQIDSPNVPIEIMLKRVSMAVEVASKGAQEPWTEGSIRGEFYFRGVSASNGTQVASVSPESTGRIPQSDPEEDAWQATKVANTVAAYDAYLTEYPKGRFAGAARIGRVALQGAMVPSVPPAQTANGAEPQRVSVGRTEPGHDAAMLIGVPQFDGEPTKLTNILHDMVSANMARTQRLRRQSFDERLGVNQRPDPAIWNNKGLDYLVAGSVKQEADGRYSVMVRLHKIGAVIADLGGQSFTVAESDFRLAAHMSSDFVYRRITGEMGQFASRNVYAELDSGKWKLWVADSDGENAQPALTSTKVVGLPTWSPDQRFIGYVSMEAATPLVFVHEVLSGQRRKLADPQPVVSACNREIALLQIASASQNAHLLKHTWINRASTPCSAAMTAVFQAK